MILGNLLKETSSNLPVIIVEEKIINNLEYKFDNKNLLKISYSSLGNENGILYGFKPKYVKIYTDDDCFEKKAIIGIYKGKFCEKSDDYNAIVGL